MNVQIIIGNDSTSTVVNRDTTSTVVNRDRNLSKKNSLHIASSLCNNIARFVLDCNKNRYFSFELTTLS